MRYLKGFAWFWYDFIIGDDWKIAAAVVLALLLTLLGLAVGILTTTTAPVVGGALVVVAFTISMVVDVRRS